jgi:hypothetical protein
MIRTFIEYVRVIIAFPFAVAAFLTYSMMMPLAILACLIGGEPYEEAVEDFQEIQ